MADQADIRVSSEEIYKNQITAEEQARQACWLEVQEHLNPDRSKIHFDELGKASSQLAECTALRKDEFKDKATQVTDETLEKLVKEPMIAAIGKGLRKIDIEITGAYQQQAQDRIMDYLRLDVVTVRNMKDPGKLEAYW